MEKTNLEAVFPAQGSLRATHCHCAEAPHKAPRLDRQVPELAERLEPLAIEEGVGHIDEAQVVVLASCKRQNRADGVECAAFERSAGDSAAQRMSKY